MTLGLYLYDAWGGGKAHYIQGALMD